jgi:glutaminase
MNSCGMNNYTGEYAFKIGVPSKSGISGSIMVVVPGKLGICTYSPLLDNYGNSVRGINFLENLS